MNTKKNTPPYTEKKSYKVLFEVANNSSVISQLRDCGVIVNMEQTGRLACACFDNLIDYNDFKDHMRKQKKNIA